MGFQRVGASLIGDKHRLLVAAPLGRGEELIPGLVGEPLHFHIVPLGGTHPPHLGEDDGHRLARGQLLLGERLGLFALHQRRATIIAILLGIGQQLFFQQVVHPALGAQQLLELIPLLGQFLLLGADLHLFQARQLAQLGIEDVIRLLFAQGKARHQHRLGILLGTDDMDHLVQIEIGDEQAFQQVQAPLYLVQPVLQTTAHRLAAEGDPFTQQSAQILDLRQIVEPQDVEIDPIALLQIGTGKEVLHQLLHIHPVGARHYDDTGRILMVGLIPQIGDHRQLLGLHLGSDLFEDLGTRSLMGQSVNDDLPILHPVERPHTDGALAGLVDFTDLGAGGDDLGMGGIIRPLHMGHQIRHCGGRILQQRHTGMGHLAGIVGRDIGSHAHRYAGHTVEQNMGQTGRQELGLLQGAVEIGCPLHRSLLQLGEQQLGELGQARLGITHGGKGFGIIRRPPVPLTIHQRVTVGEGLSHQHHGLITGRIPVGMILTQHIPDGAG